MKRFFFTVIAVAAVASGCTKGGVLESPQTFQDPISFEPYTGKAPVTKATVANDATLLEGFRVIGFEETSNGEFDATKPFLRKMVTGVATTTTPEGGEPVTTTDWSYDGAMFWPGGNVSFVAYGLNVNTTSSATKPTAITTQGADYGDVQTAGTDIFKMSGTDYTSFTYNVQADRAKQKDLIISPVVSQSSGEVALNLYHVLSRVGFSIDIQNNAANPPAVAITSIKLTGNFISSATFDLKNAVVSGETVSYNVRGNRALTTYEFFGEGESFTTYASGKQEIDVTDNDERFLMIVPTGNETGVGSDAEVVVTYSIGGVPQTPAKLSLASDFKFLAGKAYEFVFTLSTVAVGFGVEIDDWNAQAEQTHPLK